MLPMLIKISKYLFPDEDGPKYILGFAVISAMLALGVAVFLFLHIWLRRQARSPATEATEMRDQYD